MKGLHHALVWMDYREARVFRFNEETEIDVRSHTSLQRLHHRTSRWEAGGNTLIDTEFYQRIMGNLDPTGAILITGPGKSKLDFSDFLDRFRPSVAARVCALETLDQPGANSLLALVRQYFKRDIRSQSPN